MYLKKTNTHHLEDKAYRILHITPHLGGGVGRVLLNYYENVKKNPDFSHKVICLDYANDKAILASQTTGVPLMEKMSSDHKGIIEAIADSDIVLIHWWNHPLLYDFLVRETLPPSRVIFWSHISGLHAPYIFTRPALLYPDIFVFTSPLSLDIPEVKNLQEERRKDLRVIWSTGGIEHVASVKYKPHCGYKVGYIGTVDYGKMHPSFLQMSSRVGIADVQFIVCGGPSERQIMEEAIQYGMEKHFVFTGQIDDISAYLSEFDVFGYPLTPNHYGTCEQSLGESMAAGVPPVVLANKTESYIVDDGVTGVVAADEKEYVQAIEELYQRPELRRRLSRNAREAARKQYSLDRMVGQWENVFNETLRFPKTKKKWTGKYSGKAVAPHNIFLEALEDYGKEFMNSLNARNEKDKKAARDDIINLAESSAIWKSNTRGTAKHYNYFFPDDDYLKLWSDLMHIESKHSYE